MTAQSLNMQLALNRLAGMMDALTAAGADELSVSWTRNGFRVDVSLMSWPPVEGE